MSMNDYDGSFDHGDAALQHEISDEALEAAASGKGAAAAMSFPNAPTVSILIMCCSNG
jgi:hypothetical protein